MDLGAAAVVPSSSSRHCSRAYRNSLDIFVPLLASSHGDDEMSPDADAAEATAAAGPVVGSAGGGGVARGVIRWDEILPRRSLRVLLVEHDDSTRQVVTALLRKCGYRVAAVADGMKAWEVMRGRAYAFDLVLTEVNMPTLSGIDLLSRIVAADECRNIPVISKPPEQT